MACSRINDYWHLPAPDGFVEYLITRTGLSTKDQEIARNYRTHYGDTQFFADLAQLPFKRFCAHSGEMHRRIVSVLIELAIIGWRTKYETPK